MWSNFGFPRLAAKGVVTRTSRASAQASMSAPEQPRSRRVCGSFAPASPGNGANGFPDGIACVVTHQVPIDEFDGPHRFLDRIASSSEGRKPGFWIWSQETRNLQIVAKHKRRRKTFM